ncbi:MAG: chorismate-binding protein [Candidatus Anaerobiospirillum pullicola]|uniref:Chorismate-binding protein n=1 Tax=Candidatus Anaerobiospirillum pullicola TaxID=2838451 RepID=A0A948WZL7_9GAMM|nr:chorismate-binding protein [Candidatus Anaerobiospirillum pullicola]
MSDVIVTAELSSKLRILLQALVLIKLPFVLYRLPEGRPHLLVLTSGTCQSLTSWEQLDAASGFVLAPFALTERYPLVLWPQEHCVHACGYDEITHSLMQLTKTNALYQEGVDKAASALPISTAEGKLTEGDVTIEHAPKEQYSRDFAAFMTPLRAQRYQKLVLSARFAHHSPRCYVWDNFQRACAVKPQLMVALVQAPQVGTWFVATPEVLLRTSPRSEVQQPLQVHTMSLAGTMPYNEDNLLLEAWSAKDRHEQAYVTSYLTELLGQYDSFATQGPYPIKAGQVVHLRTDLTCEVPAQKGLGQLISALHPTPAVCGLPKADAQSFIQSHESGERSYYSGFLGEINCASDRGVRSNLFVHLRTIEFLALEDCWGPWRFRSYVGGGLLVESELDSEYAEICAKNRSVLSNLVPKLWMP